MTHIELQARKLNLIQDIINNVDNDELMTRLERAYMRLKKSVTVVENLPVHILLKRYVPVWMKLKRQIKKGLTKAMKRFFSSLFKS